MDINSDEVIWNFVSQYSINGLIVCTTNSLIEHSISLENFRVYPNPVNSQLTIDIGLLEEKEFRLYNAIGELLLSGVLNAQISIIDLSSLAPNVYILNIENQSIRLIKTR